MDPRKLICLAHGMARAFHLLMAKVEFLAASVRVEVVARFRPDEVGARDVAEVEGALPPLLPNIVNPHPAVILHGDVRSPGLVIRTRGAADGRLHQMRISRHGFVTENVDAGLRVIFEDQGRIDVEQRPLAQLVLLIIDELLEIRDVDVPGLGHCLNRLHVHVTTRASVDRPGLEPIENAAGLTEGHASAVILASGVKDFLQFGLRVEFLPRNLPAGRRAKVG